MEQIIIDGVNLSDLKVKYDTLAAEQAAMRSSIAKGSSKFIADTVEAAKAAMNKLLEVEDKEEITALANEAYTLLKTVEFVSDVSGVGFTIPYYDRQSEYYPDGEAFSNLFEESDNEVLPNYGQNKTFDNLLGLLENMESTVAEWNTSYC